MNNLSIFIDGANIHFCQRYMLKWWIDWKRFLSFYQTGHNVQAAHYYLAFHTQPSDEDRAFGHFLSTNGYTLHEKQLKKVRDQSTGQEFLKGNLDIELVIDALTTADRYDICVLVTGDGDFVPLVRTLRLKGKTVHVVSTPGSVAIELRREVGLDFVDLQDIRRQIERKDYIRPESKDVAPESGVFPLKVAHVQPYGAFLENPWGAKILLHVSTLGIKQRIEDASEIIQPGEAVTVRILGKEKDGEDVLLKVELADEAYRSVLMKRLERA